MKIVNAGYNYVHPLDFSINRPFGSGDYIFLALKTDAYFVLNGEKQITPANSVIIYDLGTPQNYGAIKDMFVNDWLHFEMNEAERERIVKLGIPFDTILTFNNVNIFSQIIKSIFTEHYSENIHKEDSERLYFNLIINKLSEKIKAIDFENDNPYYDKFCDLRNKILLAPQNDWNVDDICAELNLSRSYVLHCYKKFFGTTIISDVTYGRMEYAKYLLSSTDFTVGVISEMCGYANDVHFMRLFKKNVGVTPTLYRDEFKVVQSEVESGKNKNPFCL